MSSELEFLEQPSTLDGDTLGNLHTKLTVLSDLRGKIEEAEAALKELKAEERRQSREEIPGFLLQFGINKIDLEDGTTVSVKEDLTLSLPKTDMKKRQTVMKFLIDQGAGGLIKDELTLEDPSIAVMDQLDKEGVAYKRAQNVNTQSLKAFARGVLGLNKNTPATLSVEELPKELNCFIIRETKIS